ncbi:MAG: hypothetical protein JWO37_1438 [Acidimicrobiales bacterium]|nr:hypothetical protein [Acidimicrobiales bacterium]
MKLLAFRTFGDDQMEIVLHPRVTVLGGLDPARRARLAAALDAMLAGDVGAGEAVFEIDGVRLPLTNAVWRDLAVGPASSRVLRPADLPGARVLGHRATTAGPSPDGGAAPDPRPADGAMDEARSTIADLERSRVGLETARDTAAIAMQDAQAYADAVARPAVPETVRVDVAALVEVPASLLADARANLDAARRELAELEREPGASHPALVAELEAAHAEVVDAEDRAGRGGKRRFAGAAAREAAVLERMGMPSYGAFLLRTSVLESISHDHRITQARLALADAQAVWDELHAAPEPPVTPLAKVEADRAAEAAADAAALVAAQRLRELASIEDELSVITGQVAVLNGELGELGGLAHAPQEPAERRAEQDAVLDLTPSAPLIVAAPVEVDASGVDGEALEIYLLSRLLDHRSSGGRAGSIPLVVDDAFGDLTEDVREDALTLLSRMAEGVQVVYLTDRSEMELWAFAQGPGDALSVTAPEPASSPAGSSPANAR